MTTLDEAKGEFLESPARKTAARYLRTLMEYEADGMIGDDTFLDGIADVIVWLDPDMLLDGAEI